MMDILVYPAVSGKAGLYAAAYLESHGIQTIRHPSPEITHLLLDVPCREIPPELLERLPEDVCITGGNLDDPQFCSYRKLDLLKNEWYLCKNAAITAECSLRVAAEHMDLVFAGTPVLIVGWGRIGKCLAMLLKNIGASVTIAARREQDRSMIDALGYASSLPGLLPKGCRIVFNTVPSPVMDAYSSCLNIDLASRQGILGDNVIWARGLPGKYAPESSGQLIGEAFLREVAK